MKISKFSKLYRTYVILIATFLIYPIDFTLAGRELPTKNASSLKMVQEAIQETLKAGVDPGEVVVVLDLHDTLTNESKRSFGKAVPHPGADDLLKYLNDHDIKTVISSAFPNFSQVLDDIRQFGTHRFYCGTDSETKFSNYTTIKTPENGPAKVTVYQNNKAISIRPSGSSSSQLFINKALSPYELYGSTLLTDVKKVFIVDDQLHNLKQFGDDVKSFSLYPQADIQPIHIQHASQVEAPRQAVHPSVYMQPSSNSMLEQIKQLPPGYVITVTFGGQRLPLKRVEHKQQALSEVLGSRMGSLYAWPSATNPGKWAILQVTGPNGLYQITLH